jgi:DNA-binding transcriptional MerR regulator
VPRTTWNAAGYRMQDLIKVTGTPTSTILFYLAQGLLPQPERTGPNTAVYDPACVERIRFIRQLQTHHRLTLAEIRERLGTETAGELKPYLELDETVFGESGTGMGRLDFCRATGLEPAQLDELERSRLLQPLAEGVFDGDDVAMGRMYRSAFDSGIRPRDLSYYVELGEAIVAAEMALRDRLTGRLPRPQDAAATTRLMRSARMCRAYVIDRIFQKQVAAMKHLKSEEPPPSSEPEREPWLD